MSFVQIYHVTVVSRRRIRFSLSVFYSHKSGSVFFRLEAECSCNRCAHERLWVKHFGLHLGARLTGTFLMLEAAC